MAVSPLWHPRLRSQPRVGRSPGALSGNLRRRELGYPSLPIAAVPPMLWSRCKRSKTCKIVETRCLLCAFDHRLAHKVCVVYSGPHTQRESASLFSTFGCALPAACLFARKTSRHTPTRQKGPRWRTTRVEQARHMQSPDAIAAATAADIWTTSSLSCRGPDAQAPTWTSLIPDIAYAAGKRSSDSSNRDRQKAGRASERGRTRGLTGNRVRCPSGLSSSKAALACPQRHHRTRCVLSAFIYMCRSSSLGDQERPTRRQTL